MFFLQVNRFIICILGLCIAAALLASCAGRRQSLHEIFANADTLIVIRTDTVERTVAVHIRDTLRLIDSITLREYVTVRIDSAGDTVWRDRTVYRDRWHEASRNFFRDSTKMADSRSVAAVKSVRADTVFLYKENKHGASTLSRRVSDIYSGLVGIGVLGALLFFGSRLVIRKFFKKT